MAGVIDAVIQPVIGEVIRPVVGPDAPATFRALAANMGGTNDLVVVSFSDVPQNFNPIAGVVIEVDGVDDLNAAVAPVLNGQTLTYTLNSVAATGVLIQWIYSQPPGLISDGVDLAPSRTLTAQTAATVQAWELESGAGFWELESGVGFWDLENPA